MAGGYVTLKSRVDKTAAEIKELAAQKLRMGNGEGVDLVEMKSSGERVIYTPTEVSVPSMLSLNGQLFVCYKDQVDQLVSRLLSTKFMQHNN